MPPRDELEPAWLKAMVGTGRRGANDAQLVAEAERVHIRLESLFLSEEWGGDGTPEYAIFLAWETFRKNWRLVKAVRRILRREIAEEACRRGRAISAAELEAEEWNRCHELVGGGPGRWRAEGGLVVFDADPAQLRDPWRRESWRRALSARLAGLRRPLAHVHNCGRARRGRRVTVRRAPAQSPGRDPEPSRQLEAAA